MISKQPCELCKQTNVLNDPKSSKYFCYRCLDKLTDENIPLAFSEFQNVLQSEYAYFEEGSYRKETTRLALNIALKVRDVNVFLNPENAKSITVTQLKNYDVDRINDVAKMLRILARGIHREKTMTNEVKEYIEEKMKNTKLRIIDRNTNLK